MYRFIGEWLIIAVAATLTIASVASPTAEAKHPKPPKDAPGLELPILAGISTLGYGGYYYLKHRKR